MQTILAACALVVVTAANARSETKMTDGDATFAAALHGALRAHAGNLFGVEVGPRHRDALAHARIDRLGRIHGVPDVEQPPLRRQVDERADAARRVPGQAHHHHRAVAEEVEALVEDLVRLLGEGDGVSARDHRPAGGGNELDAASSDEAARERQLVGVEQHRRAGQIDQPTRVIGMDV